MALIEGLEFFRNMVYGLRVVCEVDQRSLEWLISNTSLTKYLKYSTRLEEFNIDVKYTPAA